MALPTRSRIPTFLIVTALTALPVGPAGAAAEPNVKFEGLSVEQQSIAHWALELFAEAELELPAVRLVASPDPGGCEGFDGIAHPGRGHVQVTLCTDQVGPAAELLVLHELAHAWDFHNLTSESRASFSALRNTNTWLDREVEWYERGAEHAAEIIVWGLIDRPHHPVKIFANTCSDLEAGYRILTGQAPLHGFIDYC